MDLFDPRRNEIDDSRSRCNKCAICPNNVPTSHSTNLNLHSIRILQPIKATCVHKLFERAKKRSIVVFECDASSGLWVNLTKTELILHVNVNYINSTNSL